MTVETISGKVGVAATTAEGENIIIFPRSEFTSKELDLAGLSLEIVAGIPYRLDRIDASNHTVVFAETDDVPSPEFYRAAG